MKDARSSVSRVAPAVTMKDEIVLYQEVTVLSFPELECVTAFPEPAAAVMVMTAAVVLAAAGAAPAPFLPQAASGAA